MTAVRTILILVSLSTSLGCGGDCTGSGFRYSVDTAGESPHLSNIRKVSEQFLDAINRQDLDTAKSLWHRERAPITDDTLDQLISSLFQAAGRCSMGSLNESKVREGVETDLKGNKVDRADATVTYAVECERIPDGYVDLLLLNSAGTGWRFYGVYYGVYQ